MVSVRLQFVDSIVQIPVRQHSDWAIRLVALLSIHVSAPKVVVEKVLQFRLRRIEIIIGENSSVVVKNEASL